MNLKFFLNDDKIHGKHPQVSTTHNPNQQGKSSSNTNIKILSFILIYPCCITLMFLSRLPPPSTACNAAGCAKEAPCMVWQALCLCASPSNLVSLWMEDISSHRDDSEYWAHPTLRGRTMIKRVTHHTTVRVCVCVCRMNYPDTGSHLM